jgi:hypothetical protein
MERNGAVQSSLNTYYSQLSEELVVQPERIHAVPQRQQEFQQLVGTAIAFASDLYLVEIACGIGFWTERLKAHARFIHATDICEVALQRARQRVQSDRVRFAPADALAIDLPNDGVTGVFGGFWLSHVKRSSLAGFFAHLHSQLPAGARVLFLENEYPQRHNRPFASIDHDGDTFELRRLRNGSKHLVLKNYFSDNELITALGARVSRVCIERSKYYWSLYYQVSAN